MKKLAIILSLSISSILLNAQQTTIHSIDQLMENSIEHLVSTKQHAIVQIKKEQSITADQFVQAKKQEWLDHPKADLFKVNLNTSATGKVHSSYQQTWNGIQIEGQYILTHEKNGQLEAVNGTLIKHLKLNTTPTLTPKQAIQPILNTNTKYAWQLPALEQALQDSKNDQSASWYPQGELIITKNDNRIQNPARYQLAWRFEVYSIEPHELQAIYIDAHTGALIKRSSLMNHTYTQGSGQTNYNGIQSFSCKDHGNHYQLKNEAVNVKKFNGAFYNPGQNILSLDNNNWQGKEYAIDVLWGTEQMVDYLEVKLGRNHFDDNGGQIKALTGIDNINNAFWNGSFMGFGSGDGNSMQSATSIDIVAHEYAHAMLDHIVPGNGFTYAGESGAIEEAYCDIFGELLEHYSTGNADWKVGSQITLTNGVPNNNGLRDLSTPRQYKDALWHDTPADNWGVHFNSAIYSHWFYLLVNIYNVNIDTAAHLIYETLYYLQPASDYIDLWATSVNLANSNPDFQGIATEVQNAWADVGFTGITAGSRIFNIQPSNGQIVYGGFTDTISWDTSLLVSLVNIEYSINGGLIWDTIAIGYDYTIGNYAWAVPQHFSNTVVIRITDAMNALTRGISNNYFSLVNTANIPPIANNDVVATTQGFFEIIQPWTNDTDEDALDVNSLGIVTTIPANEGTLTLQGNSIRINVAPSFIGSFSFDYQICDLGAPILCDTATVLVNAEEAPTIHWAMDDWLVVNLNNPNFGNVMNNDYLIDPSWFDTWGSINLSHGSLFVTMSGGYSYSPTSLGRDTLEYYVENGSTRDTGHLYLFVVEDRPLANDSMNLVILYEMTNGLNWSANWDLDTLVNTWNGISVSQDNVTQISLNNNNLIGSIPDLNLPSLVSLSLRENQIECSIPNFNMPSLQTLVLNQNLLFGTIPDFNLPSLKTLDLGKNEITGLIPDFNLTNLLKLDLRENQITGSIPDFNLPNLNSLSLNVNNLSGSIPGFNLPSLKTIYLNQNVLDDQIPNFNTNNLPELTILNFDDNQLSGSLPMFDLPLLKSLSLANNLFNDTIPDFNLPDLLSLILSGNQLTGSIPDFDLNNLTILRLGGNQLTGTIPTFSSINNLSELRLDYNQLTGPIPDLSHINSFSLTFNLLTFTGLEHNLGNPLFMYNPQKRTPIIQLGDTLNVYAGDTIAENTYHWYHEDNPIPDTIVGQEYFIPGIEGNYVCWVYNEDVPNFILYSDTVYLIPTCNIVTTLPNSITMCAGDTIFGNLNQRAYNWQLNDSIVGTARALAVYESGVYILKMRDSCQNLATDTIQVTIDSNCIYPGDTNQDGIVNQHDLLNIGLHFGANGPTRSDTSTRFNPLMGYDWSDSTNANINLKHVDTNGDGNINDADALAVNQNYGKMWKTPVLTTAKEISDIQLIPTITNAANGTLKIAYTLGSNRDVPFQYYGLAFDTRIDAPIEITGNALALDSNSFNLQEYLLITKQPLPYLMESAFTRTNLQDYSISIGSSEFGNSIGAIEDDLGGGDSVSVIQISTEKILVTTVNSSFNTGSFNLQVAGGSTTLYYYDSTFAVTLTPTPSYCDTAGSITVDVLNGSGLTYQWDSGQNGPTASNLAVGIHTVTIVSGSDTIVASGEVEGVNPIEITSIVSPPALGQQNGEINITPSGGLGTYNILWSDGQTGPIATGLSFCEPYTVLVEDDGACAEAFTFNANASREKSMQLKVKLEGPYLASSTLMHDGLRADGLLPLLDPYDLGVITDSSVFNTTGADGIVDWIHIELRDSATLGTVDSFALLLQRDGDIVDIDGISIPTFCGDKAAYFVVVKHRNHLPVMSAQPIVVHQNTGLYHDFTSQISYSPNNTGNPTKLLGNTYLLWAGNAASSVGVQIVTASDRSEVWNRRNQLGYLQADVNLDGVCNAVDRSMVWNNRNKTSYVLE